MTIYNLWRDANQNMNVQYQQNFAIKRALAGPPSGFYDNGTDVD